MSDTYLTMTTDTVSLNKWKEEQYTINTNCDICSAPLTDEDESDTLCNCCNNLYNKRDTTQEVR